MGLFRTAANVAVASAVHGRVQQRQRSRWAAQQQAAEQQAAQQHAAQQAAAQQAAEFLAQQQAAAAQTVAPPEPQPVQPQQVAAEPMDFDTKLERLAKLGELRDNDVLTDEEFEQQKTRLLAL